MSMDVVVLNDFAETNGGAAWVALSSAVALANRGHRVTVFSAVAPASDSIALQNVRVVVTGQQEIAADPNRWRAVSQGLWNAKARARLALTLETLDPTNTIVHLHGWTKALTSSVVRECVDSDFRVICTLHDYFTACPNGGFYNFRTNSICHLRPMSWRCITENCDSRNYPQKVWRVARQAVQIGAGGIPRSISAFITVSTFSSNVLRPYLPVAARMFEIRNPVVSVQEPPAQMVADSPFLYVGRLSPEKGGALLATAAIGVDCGLVYVGDGIARADIAALNATARFTGWLPRAETFNWLKRARALVLPSLWYETQGLVVLEAAAVGVPAIVPDTSAARDLVRDGVTGLWFKGGNMESLRSALNRLQNVGTARLMGYAAYEHYWRNPATIDAHVAQLESAYIETLQGAGG